MITVLCTVATAGCGEGRRQVFPQSMTTTLSLITLALPVHITRYLTIITIAPYFCLLGLLHLYNYSFIKVTSCHDRHTFTQISSFSSSTIEFTCRLFVRNHYYCSSKLNNDIKITKHLLCKTQKYIKISFVVSPEK